MCGPADYAKGVWIFLTIMGCLWGVDMDVLKHTKYKVYHFNHF